LDRRKLKIMILNHEEDVINLYSDYVSRHGHEVIKRNLNDNDLMSSLHEDEPDVCLIDDGLPGKTNPIHVATDILNNSPSMPILLITGYEPLRKEASESPILQNKNIQILVKPARMTVIEDALFDLAKNRKQIAK
jgi:DNA-binding NtrC family response regulator